MKLLVSLVLGLSIACSIEASLLEATRANAAPPSAAQAAFTGFLLGTSILTLNYGKFGFITCLGTQIASTEIILPTEPTARRAYRAGEMAGICTAWALYIANQ